MSDWDTYTELWDLMKRELFTAVVGDVMDKLGLQSQFLPPQIKPLRDDMVVVGHAMPVLEADVFGEVVKDSANSSLKSKPFGLMFAALDDLKPGEIYVCTGASLNYALWGGLMSTRARHLQAGGAVLDGYSRDTREILSLNFPTFSHGTYAQDQGPRGKVIDFRIPIRIGNVAINPGDIVFGDMDGVCVIPREAERDVSAAALEKVRGENRVRSAIQAGMSASEAFEKFGIM